MRLCAVANATRLNLSRDQVGCTITPVTTDRADLWTSDTSLRSVGLRFSLHIAVPCSSGERQSPCAGCGHRFGPTTAHSSAAAPARSAHIMASALTTSPHHTTTAARVSRMLSSHLSDVPLPPFLPVRTDSGQPKVQPGYTRGAPRASTPTTCAKSIRAWRTVWRSRSRLCYGARRHHAPSLLAATCRSGCGAPAGVESESSRWRSRVSSCRISELDCVSSAICARC
mmetsp:Transcript_40599/g.111691  ORF Transcript_40599/g.111691 Transcript_40599/m.111691 type:complete len:227 (+) Transcript_40599:47-727(+)